MKLTTAISALAFLGSASAFADWPQIFVGSHPATRANNVITDKDGNVIVQGVVEIDSFNIRALVVKYDRLGNFKWSKELTGFDNTSQYSVGVDGPGSVYVLGQLDELADYRTVKLDVNGNKVWTNVAHAKPAPDNYYDSPCKVIGLPLGGCIVTGSSGTNTTSYDVYTIYYGPAGNKVWSRQLDINTHAEYVDDLATNSAGDIFITGATSGADNGDLYVVKYDKSGLKKWVRKYDGDLYDEGHKLAVDKNGGVIVAGGSKGPNDTYDAVVLRYDSDGNKLWTHRFFRPTTDDQSTDIRLLPDGTIGVTVAVDAQPLYQVFVYRLDSSGNKIWLRIIEHQDSDGGNRLYFPIQMAVDSSGSIYVGCDFANIDEIQYVNKFSIDGDHVWEKSYQNEYSSFDGLTWDPVYGKVYTVCTSFVDHDHSSIDINKY